MSRTKSPARSSFARCSDVAEEVYQSASPRCSPLRTEINDDSISAVLRVARGVAVLLDAGSAAGAAFLAFRGAVRPMVLRLWSAAGTTVRVAGSKRRLFRGEPRCGLCRRGGSWTAGTPRSARSWDSGPALVYARVLHAKRKRVVCPSRVAARPRSRDFLFAPNVMRKNCRLAFAYEACRIPAEMASLPGRNTCQLEAIEDRRHSEVSRAIRSGPSAGSWREHGPSSSLLENCKRLLLLARDARRPRHPHKLPLTIPCLRGVRPSHETSPTRRRAHSSPSSLPLPPFAVDSYDVGRRMQRTQSVLAREKPQLFRLARLGGSTRRTTLTS